VIYKRFLFWNFLEIIRQKRRVCGLGSPDLERLLTADRQTAVDRQQKFKKLV
jgi:hypothetical protein